MRKVFCFVALSFLCGIAFGEDIVIEKLKWQKQKTAEKKPTNITLETKFFVPAGHEKSRWVFEAERAGGNFGISVNGKKVGEREAPIFQIELANIQSGTNTLECYCARDYENLPELMKKRNAYRALLLQTKNENNGYGNHKMGFFGRERIVELSSPADVRRAWAETSVREKKITIHATVSSVENFEGVISCVIREKGGKQALNFSQPVTIEKGEKELSFSSSWENPKLWDVGQPNLYHADITLMAKGGRKIDALQPFRFGFREVWTEGRKVMLNGHPFHARMEMGWLPMTTNSLGFFKYIGRNTWYVQPHPNCWWGWWGETPELYQSQLDICDENGIACFFPTVGVTHKGELCDKKLHESYKENLKKWMDIFRNRPSIIAWGVSMNAYNPKGSIAPDALGRREPIPRRATDGWSTKKISIDYATRFCKEADPTRLAYGHADGAIGDISSANCYPNMTPLQEVIDYPAKWAKDGDMPWAAVEYGVYDGSFYKNEVIYLTEYASIYFGEDAYNRETQKQLEMTIEHGKNCRFYGGNMLKEVVKTTDLYWDFMRLFTGGTDRYWRAYGMLGWLHFFGGRYGQEEVGGWGKIKTPTSATEAPEWATPQVEINRKNMQDLLAFIGGKDAYSDVTHTYYEGEEIVKNAVIVWDGANAIDVSVAWKIEDSSGKQLASGKKTVNAKPGETATLPIVWKSVKRAERSDYKISIKAVGRNHKMTDSFDVTVFPREKNIVNATGNVYFFDPAKKSGWVKEMMPQAKDFAKGTKLQAGDLLVIGREALKKDQLLPYKMEDVKKGVRILVLEQSPITLGAFGFRLVDMVTRNVYETPYSKELMNGLAADDLKSWRGTPTLLPEFKHVRNVAQPPKGMNRHGVASTVFEIPNVYGFEPMFQCEFDLRYSPLLRLRSGDGAIYYSTFDFTGRVGVDPAATKLAKNLLTLFLKPTRKATKIVAEKFDEKADILVNTGVVDPKTDAFLAKGGIVLNIALKDEELSKRGIKFEKKKLYRVKPDGDLSVGATRNMFRWRDAIDVNCITESGAQSEGVWYRKGKEIFLQVGSSLIENRYDRKTQGREWQSTLLSVLALDLLKSRVLTILGAAPEKVYCDRLDSVCSALPFAPLEEWHLYGPFKVKPNAIRYFEEKYPGEEQAIRGDMNPNIVHRLKSDAEEYYYNNLLPESKEAAYDFRKVAHAGDDGYVNLTEELKLEGNASYVYMIHTWKEENAGDAVFSFSFPSKAIVYINGEKVFSTLRSAGTLNGAREVELNAFSSRFKLKAGENVMTIKLVTLAKEWKNDWPQRVAVTRALDGMKMEDIIDTINSCTLYNSKGNIGYAYNYHYW